MEIIHELEPNRRGVYSGAIGYFDFTGDMNTCIAIRTMVLEKGNVYFQSGAGIVFDSDPTKEYEETVNKAKAINNAIDLAENGLNMVKPLKDGIDHTIGDRFYDMSPDAMSLLNRVGNRLINMLFFKIYGEDFRDVLSGYHAFKKDSIKDLFLTSEGFGIEIELGIRCVSRDISTEVVPISYRSRTGDSVAKLNPIRDGIVIVKTLYKLAQTSNPLFYFGSIGIIGLIIGGILGGYAMFEWIYQSRIHQVVIVIGAFFLLLGSQIVMLGMFSETILELHREKRNSIRKD